MVLTGATTVTGGGGAVFLLLLFLMELAILPAAMKLQYYKSGKIYRGFDETLFIHPCEKCLATAYFWHFLK
jgi:hypothetical protein